MGEALRKPFGSSLPGVTRQSILLVQGKMDARVKPAHDEVESWAL
jgi:hypothetical protein